MPLKLTVFGSNRENYDDIGIPEMSRDSMSALGVGAHKERDVG